MKLSSRQGHEGIHHAYCENGRGRDCESGRESGHVRAREFDRVSGFLHDRDRDRIPGDRVYARHDCAHDNCDHYCDRVVHHENAYDRDQIHSGLSTIRGIGS